MNSTGLNVINKQLDYLDANPINGITYSGEDFKYVFSLIGPSQSAFYNYVLKLEIIFPDNYPQTKPQVKFLTNIVHPNVSQYNSLCMDSLNYWDVKYTISQLLLDILSFLSLPNYDGAYGYYWDNYKLDRNSSNRYQDMVDKIKSTMGSCRFADLK